MRDAPGAQEQPQTRDPLTDILIVLARLDQRMAHLCDSVNKQNTRIEKLEERAARGEVWQANLSGKLAMIAAAASVVGGAMVAILVKLIGP